MLKHRAQTTNPKLEQHKELPLHICNLPLRQSTLPLWDLTASGWLDRPKRPTPPNFIVKKPYTKLFKNCLNTLNTFQILPGAQNMHNLPPLLTMNESRQNAKSFNIELLKYTTFITRCYTCPNKQVRYSIAS
jgi:hypothetical protein